MSDTLPAYLVRGDDPVLLAEAARGLIRRLVGDGDASLLVEEHLPDGDGADTAPIADAAQTPPFLADRRIVVAREVDGYSSDALAPLLGYLADPLPTTSVVLVGSGKRISQKLVNAVKKVGNVVETSVPTGRGRGSWLAEHLRAAPVRLDPGAVSLLDEHLGEDLGRLTGLLETLAAAYGAGARVGPDDLRPFLGEAGSVPPWELTDAIDRGDAAGAIVTLHRMTGAGERHALQVMAILHTHYARMLRLDGADVADEAAAAGALGMKGSTFPARKVLDQARRLGHEGVAEAISLLAAADLDLRGTKGWPDELVLEVLVARLSKLRRRTGRPARR